MTLNKDAPPDWAKDTLTMFFDQVRAHQYAVFHNKKVEFSDMVQVEALFVALVTDWVDPNPEYPALFFLRSHSAFRAAAGAAAAGQLVEMHALLRLCLEHAGYGFYIGGDRGRFKAWLARHDSEQTKKYVRDNFTAKRANNALCQASPPLGKAFGVLYERLIDLGAHPNERGYSMSTSIKKEPIGGRIDTIYLHDDGPALNLGLKTAAQVGICAVSIAHLLYGDRFDDLGLSDRLKTLKERH